MRDAGDPGAQHPFAIGGEPVGGIERADAIEHGAADAQAVDGARPAEQEVGVERRRRALVGAGDGPATPPRSISAKVASPRAMPACGRPRQARHAMPRARPAAARRRH